MKTYLRKYGVVLLLAWGTTKIDRLPVPLNFLDTNFLGFQFFLL